MTNEKLNQFILHYLTEDKTQSALMLTGAWGTGKSYYIQNSLIKYLEDSCDRKCIVVSLYGMKDLSEVSKSLYFETRFKVLNTSNERDVAGKLAAKTILKGITSFFGIDLTRSDEELTTLYKSIDLTGKLIVFEDVERSAIDILEILSYVNNLVESDGVKVLLVVNEQEILKYIESEPDKDGKTYKIPDEKTSKYLKIKEKTIGDTIQFTCNLEGAIENILKLFKNSNFDDFLQDRDSHNIPRIVNEIIKVTEQVKNHNLRAIQFGCQKAIDLYKYFEDVSEDKSYLKFVLIGTIAFSLRLNQDSSLIGAAFSPVGMGTLKFPLEKFCYDYIKSQEINKEAIQNGKVNYFQQKEFKEKKASVDKDLIVIYSFYESTEKDVINAVNNIIERLSNTQYIPITEYGGLTSYLIFIKALLGIDDKIMLCKDAMIKNIYDWPQEIPEDFRFYNRIEFENQDQLDEFELWKKDILAAVQEKRNETIEFDYRPEHISDLYDSVCRSKTVRLSLFAEKNIPQLIDLIRECSAKQISDLRSIFSEVYRYPSTHKGDRCSLEKFREAIDKLKSEKTDRKEDKNPFDKIQLLQLDYFQKNIKDCIDDMQ